MTHAKQVSYEIAGIGVLLEAGNGSEAPGLDKPHRHFLSAKEPDIRLRILHERWPDTGERVKVFDSTSWWALYADADHYSISFHDTEPPHKENRRAILSKDFRVGTVYAGHRMHREFALSYPLEELIFISRLPERNGVIMHACGIAGPDGGFMFIGVSGAGKSTMTKLFRKQPGLKILSDDRIIIRDMDGELRMYGTPWHGEVDICENLGVPLKRIFFIKHWPKNEAARLPVAQAATTLLARCFPPFWDKDGMERTTALCADVAQRVPCYDLGFVPDERIIDFVKTLG